MKRERCPNCQILVYLDESENASYDELLCDSCYEKWEEEVNMEKQTARYYFTVTLVGSGENADEAWQDAFEGFTQYPGPTPEEGEYTVEEEEKER